jgi:HAD superfamily hydrolase (TIGR01509 family)
MADVEVVLFDLGGVLVDFVGIAEMRALAGIDDHEEATRRWLACRWMRAFERGECATGDFAEGVVADWELPVDAPVFLDLFAGWLRDPLPGAAELVAEVEAAGVAVGCLSNTNAFHWDRCAAHWSFINDMEHRYLSYELGLVKPDRELFDRVSELAEVPPDRILFLDDNTPNVEGALAAGFRSAQTRGVAAARRALVESGVLR